MDIASDETVLGDFGDVEFEHNGITSRFYRDGERFLVNTEGPGGDMADFEVRYTFGVEPLQQYLVRFPDGRTVHLGAGQFFGEMALLMDQPRSADVVATSFCHLLVLPARHFRRLLREDAELRTRMEEVARQRSSENPNNEI